MIDGYENGVSPGHDHYDGGNGCSMKFVGYHLSTPGHIAFDADAWPFSGYST